MSQTSSAPFQPTQCYARTLRKLQYCQCSEKNLLVKISHNKQEVFICDKHFSNKSKLVIYKPDLQKIPNNIMGVYDVLYIMTKTFKLKNGQTNFSHRQLSSHLPTFPQFRTILDLLIDISDNKVKEDFIKLKPERGKNNKKWKFALCESIMHAIESHNDYILSRKMNHMQLNIAEHFINTCI